MKPKISIITITYNSEKTLEETIKSVVSQGYENLEYLIIDGGSKDTTLDIVNKYRDKIAYVVSEPDKGISDAFNKGIKAATGEIIGIINSDDLLCDNALNTLAENYDPLVNVYRGNCVIWDDLTNNERIVKPTIEYKTSKFNSSVCHPSTFITKDTYQKWGYYNVSLRYMMDADVLYRFYNNKAVFRHIDYPLAKFRLGGATNSSWTKKLNEKWFVLRENRCTLCMSVLQEAFFISKNIVKSIIKHD